MITDPAVRRSLANLSPATIRATADGRKLAVVVAEAIELVIVDAGWPVGATLGSEPELLERLGVSRAVLREAIRIVEDHGIAHMRRGPGGGLIVTEPDSDGVVRSVALLLDYEQVTGKQLAEARMAVELKSVERAAHRIDSDGIDLLKNALKQEEAWLTDSGESAGGHELLDLMHRPSAFPGAHDVHAAIAAISSNPALQLFVDVLVQLTSAERVSPVGLTDIARLEDRRRIAEEIHRGHVGVAEAVISGDAAVAQYRMRRHLEAMEPWLL